MIVYLHGFNSSPRSTKAQILGCKLAELGLADQWLSPALPHQPSEAIAAVQAEMSRHRGPFCFVGSSLGGFYATHLAEKHDARAVLINPAVNPHVGLRANLGEQANLHTGERYPLTERHLDEWRSLYAPSIVPERYLLLVETGDEVLDYRQAQQRYAGARQIVIEGGDHALQSFPQHLALILDFAGLVPPPV
jgi:predicted esterase YcpF (UPF0227 family)